MMEEWIVVFVVGDIFLSKKIKNFKLKTINIAITALQWNSPKHEVRKRTCSGLENLI